MYKAMRAQEVTHGFSGWYVSNEDGSHKIYIVGHGPPTYTRAKSCANSLNKGRQVLPRAKTYKKKE